MIQTAAIRHLKPTAIRGLWMLALVIAIPTVMRSWPVWLQIRLPQLASLPPAEFLRTATGHGYWVVCCACVLAFILRASHRAPIVRGLLVVLVATQLITQTLGWDRVLLAALGIALIALCVAFVEQNIEILRELRSKNKGLSRLVLRAVLLWSPMLVVAALGYWAHLWLVNGLAIGVVYDTTPIDEYCEATLTLGQGTETRKIPCREYGGQIHVADIKSKSMTEEFVQHAIGLYLQQQVALLKEASTVADDRYQDKEYLADAVKRWGHALYAGTTLSLPEIKFSDAENASFKHDPQIMALDAQWKPYQDQMDQGIGGDAAVQAWFRKMGEFVLAEQARDLQLAAAKPRQPAADQESAVSVLAQDISRALFNQYPDVGRAQAAAVAATNPTEAKALFVAELIRTIAVYSGHLKQALAATLPTWEARESSAYQEGAYHRFSVPKQCSLEKLSTRIFKGADGKVPESIDLPTFPCWPKSSADVRARPLGLTESIDQSILFWKEQRSAAIELEVQHSLLALVNTKDAAIVSATQIGERVPHSIDLGRQPCRWWPPGTWVNCLVNLIKEKAEDAYHGAREDLGAQYNEKVQATAAAGATRGEFVVLEARKHATEMLEQSAKLLQGALDRTLEWLRIIDRVLLGFVAVALLNSFLYVFALVVFDHTSAGTIRLPGAARDVQGDFRIARPGAELTLDSAFGPKLITRAVLNNQELHTVIAPWPLSAVLGRLLHRKYFGYNRGGAAARGKPLILSFSKGKYVVDWRMREGEEVIFKYGNFFGASENIELKTTISLSLSTLLLERIIFHSAYCKQGEGHLFLTTEALESERLMEDEIDTTPPYRLLAWNRHVEFSVQSELSMRSVLVDGYLLRRVAKGLKSGRMIVASPERSVSIFQGTLRFVRRLASPF